MNPAGGQISFCAGELPPKEDNSVAKNFHDQERRRHRPPCAIFGFDTRSMKKP